MAIPVPKRTGKMQHNGIEKSPRPAERARARSVEAAMTSQIESMMSTLTGEIDELRKEMNADIAVLRTVLRAAIPYLGDDARIAIDRELRKLSVGGLQGNSDKDWVRLQLAPLELGALLPTRGRVR
jgi:hypothetical protein